MIYLVRHGQTDWNLFKRANGFTDTFLNKTGLAQAKTLAGELKSVEFDACFCSPFTRARQYCEIIYNGKIVYDERLVELNCGEFEGMEETAEMWKQFIPAIQTGDKGTEKIDDFIHRNCEFCDDIMREYKGKNVLIVTHAANTRVINYYFKDKPENYDFLKRVVDSGRFINLEN
jgi:probable phosphoglycerate mutase